ncbi:hypothetical protein BKA56DRAFT_594609 [Ilyonectria sp. MPI-CAGE-AT-0026]|nr:hypothetical protein BKA56DRAFT_594609 [Ilyonectria sp. MPI-CAGE-AT-0026]
MDISIPNPATEPESLIIILHRKAYFVHRPLIMDSTSLAFGVVSLAMQLVQTATAIQQLIASYKSAATELASLSNRLEDIETICHSLEVALACCEQAPKPWDAILLKKLHKTMTHCRDKVFQLHDLVSKITSSPTRNHNPLRTMGALFLQHRGKIRQYDSDLEGSLKSLHLQMTTNLLVMNLRPSILLQSPTPTMANNGHQAGVKAPLALSKPRYEINVVEHWRQGWTSVLHVERTKTRKCSTGLHGPNASGTQDSSSFLAGSPLLGLYVELSIQHGSLSPLSIAIQFPTILDLNLNRRRPGGRLLHAIRRNSLSEVQTLFSERVLTLDTKLTWEGSRADSETSLYGLATMLDSYEICQFLIQHSPDLSERSHMSPNPGIIRVYQGYSGARIALDYINLRQDCLAPFELKILLDGIYDVGYINCCVDACKVYVSSHWAPFNLMVWEHAVQGFLRRCEYRQETYDTRGWAQIIQQAILAGLDIHHCTWARHLRGGLSALRHILHRTDTTDNALENVQDWIDMLEEAGVDIQHYLQVEIEHCNSTWDESSPWLDSDRIWWHGPEMLFKRQFIVKESRGRRLPCWIEVYSDSCTVREVFMEFPHLKQKSSFGLRHPQDDVTEQHLAWKFPIWKARPGHNDRSLLPSYPVYPPLDRNEPAYLEQHVRPSRIYHWSQEQLAGLDRACDLMESRFERRQARKMRKSGGLKRLKLKTRMPGAWVEEY